MMTESNDIAYYLRRERDCRARAEAAADSGIRMIHAQMAEAYRRRIDGAAVASDDSASRMPIPAIRIAAR